MMGQIQDFSVKELIWTIGSAPLLKSLSPTDEIPTGIPSFTFYEEEFERVIEVLGQNPLQLPTNHLDSHRRLGHRFEQLVFAWFSAHPDWTIVASNQIIQPGKTTLGEMDLIAERNGTIHHIELACKFYLNQSQSKQWSTWIGVNPVDRLDLKINKLREQLERPQTMEVKTWMQGLGLTIDHSAVIMKGWFFHHYQNITSPVWPQGVCEDCNSGWWCHESEWPHIWSHHGNWISIQPKHWLRMVHAAHDVKELGNPNADSLTLNKGNACMVAQVQWDGSAWVEMNRGIIVPDTWPN